MERIIVASDGINWMHYSIVFVNHDTKTAKVVYRWRSHKFRASEEDHAETGTVTVSARIVSGHDISRWRDDGKPGGFNGCRDNYRSTPYLSLAGTRYELEQVS